MTTAQKVIGGLLVLVSLLAGALLLSSHSGGEQQQTEQQQAAPEAGASVNHYEAGLWWFGNSFYVGSSQQLSVDGSGALTVNATSTLNGMQRVVTAVTCAANSAATSTLFAQQNPFGATSTASFVGFSASGQATTTTVLVGTSTASTGRTSSNVSATFINMSIGTSSTVWTSPGILVGPGTGYPSPGASTFRTVVVGPTELVVGTATSTAGGAGAVSYTAGLTACSGAIEWNKPF